MIIPEGYVLRRQGKWTMLLARDVADRLAPALAAPEAHAQAGSSPGRGGIYRVALPDVEAIIRPCRRGGAVRHVLGRWYVARNRPRMEFARHLEAMRRGLPVPRLLGVAWRRRGPLVEGALATAAIDGETALALVKASLPPTRGENKGGGEGKDAPLQADDTPETTPVAWGRAPSLGTPRSSVARFLSLPTRTSAFPGHPTGSRGRAPSHAQAGMPVPHSTDCLLRACGRLFRQMHDAGLEHADLHLNNVLVAPEGLYLIDLDKARYHARLSTSRRIRNLLRLRRHMIKYGLKPEDFLEILAGYGGNAAQFGEGWARFERRCGVEGADA